MLALACFCHSAAAKPDKATVNKMEEVPSLAFLEYLAELEKVDGKWVSPMDMLDENDSKVSLSEQDRQKDILKKVDKGEGQKVLTKSTDKEVKQ